MNNVISNDVISDPGLTRAAQAWSACMARNGYDSAQPNTFWQQYLPTQVPGPGAPAASPSPAATQDPAQIAAAVTDANCTLSTDLGGIYFAIQASYERQFVTANQQALTAAVRQFKANYASELSKLPALLRTTSAVPHLLHGRSGGGHPHESGRPSPARS
jgi:hypothetical protein